MTDHTSAGSVSQQSRGAPTQIWFNRKELDLILWTYGKLVSLGECRDYAIGAFKDHAGFHMFKRTAEAPTWTVEKHPHLANKQGAYSVCNAAGLVLKRGHDLAQVLRVFEKKKFEVVD